MPLTIFFVPMLTIVIIIARVVAMLICSRYRMIRQMPQRQTLIEPARAAPMLLRDTSFAAAHNNYPTSKLSTLFKLPPSLLLYLGKIDRLAISSIEQYQSKRRICLACYSLDVISIVARV